MGFDAQVRIFHQQALLETLHGRLPHGVAIFDADLRLVFANPRWSSFLDQVTDREHDHAPGTQVTDLLPDAEGLRAAARSCIQTRETVQLPGRSFATAAGERFWEITLGDLRP
jgi:PAS domain-containing protein